MKPILLLLLVFVSAWALIPNNHALNMAAELELGPCVNSSLPGSVLPCSPNYAQTKVMLDSIAARSRGRITILSAGTSVQGRAIWYAKAGNGPRVYMAWGRQHGNECVGTAAILKALERLTSNTDDIRRMLARATFILVPIFNPDGSEAGTRQNANGQDLNRDWCMQGQDCQASLCVGLRTQFPTTGGVPVPVCSCPADGREFTQPETNAIWNTFIHWKPSLVMDLHQFGNAWYPGTNILVAFQPVIPRHNKAFSPLLVHRSYQAAQDMFDVGEEFGQLGTVWQLNPANAQLPERASGRITENGKRNVADSIEAGTQHPAPTASLEMRRVCPKFERNLEELAFRIVWSQMRGITDDTIFNINPTEAYLVPFADEATVPCNIPCPDPDDDDMIDDAWYLDWKDSKVLATAA